MNDLEDRVKKYAKEKYAGLKYDGQDFFERHVLHVVSIVKMYGGTEDEIMAAYLHDVIEDTDATHEDIVLLFGEVIADIVSRLTDKKGKNRLDRHLNTYFILRRSTQATKVKLADRISNMERSIGNSFAKVYMKEYTAFKFALYDGNHLDMWAKLDRLYEQLKG